MKQMSQAAGGAGDEAKGRNVTSNGQADHLVSGSGDRGDQLSADVRLYHEQYSREMRKGFSFLTRFLCRMLVATAPPHSSTPRVRRGAWYDGAPH